ncbi:SusC/RagA family TonB-linked outer membrane protein [Zunongwangia atlantica]|uniref:TonB-dependent receptor plug n=1 Tax=Zunongwangia atlantica 22II14-10F7 TaxID=1185767 RepID=A0A1Y1T2X7_9FLAO|nr:SusC/RagA family TonB-linked outer membrane protein [Zunongwangia atlantica]ORL44954.1 TonB-dependent receptor plug [Zunongwangia atlantica 22II14-10F7]
MKNTFLNKVKGLLIYTLIVSFAFLTTQVFSRSTSKEMIFITQQQQIKGKVTDENNTPISGASIQIKNTNIGTITDFDGSYSIEASTNDTLVFSALGYKAKEILVNNQTSLNITLDKDVTALGEVVVNAGYYNTTERERTGSISSVSAAQIEKQPVNNPLGAIQGYMPGVNIVQNTGVPGGGYNIEIRGRNFINGNTEPLYIVDGVPWGSQSLGVAELSAGINNANISPLNAISPTDIESIEVLKDADATAIYGSRGANGVVLITTKKGVEGKTQFKVNLSSSMGKVSHFLDLMKTPEYLELRREAVINDGYGTQLENSAYDFVWPDLKTWDQNRYTNWQKELIGGTAVRNLAQLSISGGSAQTQFLISGAYQKETTVFPGDANYKKYSLHSNINHVSKNERFTFNMTANYTKEYNQMPRTDLTRSAYTLPPNAPELYTEDGNINWENNTWDNPLAVLDDDYVAEINNLAANINLSYQLLPNLKLIGNLGYNNYQIASYRLLLSSSRNPSFGFTPEGYSSISTNDSSRDSWIIEPQVQWNKEWGDLKVNVLIGSTFQSQTTDQLVLNGTGFPNNSLINNIAAASDLEIRSSTNSVYNYQAFFGRVNFKVLDKYILNFTGRRDGSSRFGPGRQFGNFGAIGAAWLFTKEDFMPSDSMLSYGKLRGSYGTTGSDNIGDYQFLSTYNVTGYEYNGTLVLEPSGISNPLFGWEVNKKLEVALELGFIKDRILINTAWYQNRSSNQLVGIPLAATTGFTSLTGNLDATVQNTGWEIDLNTRNILNENFKWTTTFNISIPKSKLLAFPDIENSTFASTYVVGQPISIRKLYKATGVNPETGIYEFEDYNDDGVITSLEDRQWIEDLAPEFYGGLGNTFTYKNLSLNLLFQFKKQKAFNNYRQQAAPGLMQNASVSYLNRWQQPGDDTPLMIATSGLNYSLNPSRDQFRQSNMAVSDASFIRLRNATLNYTIPNQASEKFAVDVYLQGQNLWTLTNFDGPDPEHSSHIILPPLRQISLGAQFNF